VESIARFLELRRAAKRSNIKGRDESGGTMEGMRDEGEGMNKKE